MLFYMCIYICIHICYSICAYIKTADRENRSAHSPDRDNTDRENRDSVQSLCRENRDSVHIGRTETEENLNPPYLPIGRTEAHTRSYTNLHTYIPATKLLSVIP